MSGKMKIARLALFLVIYLSVVELTTQVNDEKSLPETLYIIRSRGFIGESYIIRLSDGHPLAVYRIINPLASPEKLNKYPVVIHHGLAGDSAQMISNSDFAWPRVPLLDQPTVVERGDECIAFMMANNNYDVWLLDARGSNLNNRNITDDFGSKSEMFFNYSLDEQGLEDLPAQIDFVLAQTQTDKIIYLGYSQSTTFIFSLLAERPMYERKIAALIALAPVCYLANLQGVALAAMVPFVLTPSQVNGNFLPQPVADTFGVAIERFCSFRLTSDYVCPMFAKALGGTSEVRSGDANYFENIFKSTSIKSIKHFTQLYSSRKFQKFDYGPSENMLRYGQPTPPEYDLGRIKLPTIIIFRGGQDFLSNVPDQMTFLSKLGVRPYADIILPKYNHLDFIISKYVVKDINWPAVQLVTNILKMDGSGTALRNFNKPVMKLRLPDLVAYPNLGPRKQVLELRDNIASHVLEGLNTDFGTPVGMDLGSLSQGLDKIGNTVLNLPSRLMTPFMVG